MVMKKGLLVTGCDRFIGILDFYTGNTITEIKREKRPLGMRLFPFSGKYVLTEMDIPTGLLCIDLEESRLISYDFMKHFSSQCTSTGLNIKTINYEHEQTIISNAIFGEHYKVLEQQLICVNFSNELIWSKTFIDNLPIVECVSCRDRLFFISRKNSLLKVLNLHTGETIKEIKFDHKALSIYCNDKYFYVSGGPLTDGKQAGMYVYDINTYEQVNTKGNDSQLHRATEHDDRIYLRDSRKIISTSLDTKDTFFVFDVSIPDEHNDMQAPPCFYKDYMFIGSNNCHLWVFNYKTGKFIEKMEFGHFIANSPVVHDGRLYFNCLDGHVYCYEIPE